MKNVEVGEVFTVSGDDGEDYEVEVLAVIELEGTTYAAVGFVEDVHDDTEEDFDVFFLKVDEEGDFEPIESDEEFQKVSDALDRMLDEES